MSLQDNVKNAQPSNKSYGETVVMGIKNKLTALFKEESDFAEFARSVVTVLDAEPNSKHPFHKCEVGNVHRAILRAATFNLIPNLYDYCYMIPYNQSCKFEFGYMGLIELAKRTGNFRDIFANVVFDNDHVDIDLANGKIVHKPSLKNRGNILACYAIAEFKNGVRRIEVMGLDDFNKIKKLSQNQSVVNQWEGEFFRKSTLKRLTKTLPFSKEDRRDIVKGEDEPTDEPMIYIDDREEVVTVKEPSLYSASFVKDPDPGCEIKLPEKAEEKPKSMKEQLKESLKEEPKKEILKEKSKTEASNRREVEKEMEDQVKAHEKEEEEKARSMAEEEDPFAGNPFELGEY